MQYLAIKDGRAVIIDATHSDDAYIQAGKAFNMDAEEVEDIDLDVCVPFEVGVPFSIDDALPG